MEEYLRWDGAHVSRLKRLRETCPAKVRYEIDNPPDDTPATRLGTAVHTAVLEPEKFLGLYLRGPDGPWNKNPWKAERDLMADKNPHATVLKAEEFDLCMRAREHVLDNTRGRALLRKARTELSLRWEDPVTGGICCARLDIASPLGVVADLKKTRDASPGPRGFRKAIYDYGYDLQAAHYLAGAKALGLDVEFGFAFVCIEAEPPNCVAIYELSEDFLDKAYARLRPLLELYHQCEASGEWPGYSDGIVTLEPAAWDMPQKEK
jgi:exodeoxyribonuclease VIII